MMAHYKTSIFFIISFLTQGSSYPQEACTNLAQAQSNKMLSYHLEQKLQLENKLKTLEKTKFSAYCLSAVHVLTGAPLSAFGFVWLITTFDTKSPKTIAHSLIGAGLMYYGDKMLKKGFNKLIDYHHQKEQLTRELKNHETLLIQLTNS